jgi:protein gp37
VAERTNIEWADASWNPWHGCIKVSPGCRFCYMYREKKMYGQDPTAILRSKTTFKDPLKWLRRWQRAFLVLRNACVHLEQQNRNAETLAARNLLLDCAIQVSEDPQPKFIFTCSWSDFFITEADKWRAEAWDVIRRTPEFTYLILTKRPDRIARCLPADWGDGYPNVWLGVSAENQKYADQRIPELLKVPAAKRFLSLEPLLGPINLSGYLIEDWTGDLMNGPCEHHPGIDWVIVGGESGPVARPMEKQWALDLRNQCEAAGVDFFFKQWGEWAPADAIADSVDLALKTYDSKRELYKVGAEAAGNLLDGKHHLARPQPFTAEIAPLPSTDNDFAFTPRGTL